MFAGDVRDDAAIVKAVDATVEVFGKIDILFNNAGICAYAPAHEMTELEWDAMIDINLKGAWLVARRVIPHMIRARSGVIINNSSVMGLRGGNRLSHYAASKWGMIGLTKSWAIELAPHNVRVVSIHPTGVNTPMNDGLAFLEGATPHRDSGALGRQPPARSLGRAGGRGAHGGLSFKRQGAVRYGRAVRPRRGPSVEIGSSRPGGKKEGRPFRPARIRKEEQ